MKDPLYRVGGYLCTRRAEGLRNVYTITLRDPDGEGITLLELTVEPGDFSPNGETDYVRREIDRACEKHGWKAAPFHIEYLQELETGLPISEPPRIAERLFAMFAPKQTVDAQLGDLQEFFERDCLSLGERRAKERFLFRVVRSLLPLAIGKAKRFGIIALVIDLGRRKLGL